MLTTRGPEGFSSTLAGTRAESAEPEVLRTDLRDRVGRHGIGPIVAGSMFFGFLAAVVLVVGPFGGAQEHVISGTALLGFAAGWALLALVSARWSDQPQPWAVVPAGALALAGAGLLLFAPSTGALDALGWVWPVAVLALVVWMVVSARRQLRGRTRAFILYPVFGIMTLAAVGGGYQTISTALDRRAFAMHGQLIDVGGHRLRIECSGAGSPAVVLEAGLGEPTSNLSGWIAPAVARDTQVCVYDRAGLGWSDPGRGARDGLAVATDLHTLLDRAHVAGPYVLVGHSTGGVYVRVFAAKFPEQVAGMVLLDSQPDDAFTRLPDYPGFYAVFRRAIGLMPPLARLGVMRLSYLSDNGGYRSRRGPKNAPSGPPRAIAGEVATSSPPYRTHSSRPARSRALETSRSSWSPRRVRRSRGGCRCRMRCLRCRPGACTTCCQMPPIHR